LRGRVPAFLLIQSSPNLFLMGLYSRCPSLISGACQCATGADDGFSRWNLKEAAGNPKDCFDFVELLAKLRDFRLEHDWG
jgi:hypothetical protein